jgi:hypothetical protein
MKPTRVINFSGGRTSALMTILEYNPETDIVVFTDTGREHPKTYKFINDFEAFENIPVIRISEFDSFRKLIIKRKAIPNRYKRFCTIELKVKACRRYLRSLRMLKYDNLIGFRSDEQQRIKRRKKHWQKVTDIFPLNERNITKKDVLEYWKSKPYDLEMPSILGNCTLCFNKGKDVIIAILKEYPEYANEWIEDEEIIGHTYFKDYSIKQLLEMSKKVNKQFDLFELNPAFDCACNT